MQQEGDGHLHGTAEFAAERPSRPSAVDQKPAIDPCSGCSAREFFKLVNAVKSEEIDAPSMSVRDFCFALDGVPERQAFGADTQRLAAVNLAGAREVEIAAEFRESGNDFRRRVGLDRVEDPRVREDGAERVVLRPHDVEIDDETRSLWTTLGQKPVDVVRTDPVRCR